MRLLSDFYSSYDITVTGITEAPRSTLMTQAELNAYYEERRKKLQAIRHPWEPAIRPDNVILQGHDPFRPKDQL